MAEAPFNSPAEATGGKAPGLDTKIGSFPLGVWLLIAAAGIGVGLIIRRFTSGKASATADGEVGAPAVDPWGGFTSQGAANGVVTMNGGTGAGTTPEPAEPETNNSWVRKAVTRLGTLGYDPAVVDSALRKYVNGEAITPAEQSIVSVAISNMGPPPEEVPSIVVLTPEAPAAPTAPPPPPPTPAPVVPSGPSQEEQNRQAWLSEASRLRDLANSGQAMSDADLDKMRGMGFTTSDPSLSPTFRYFWRIWLNARGYSNSNG